VRVVLTRDVPCHPRHGLRAGRWFEVIEPPPDAAPLPGAVWVRGDAGEELRLAPGQWRLPRPGERALR
jgi:hypothetical protein